MMSETQTQCNGCKFWVRSDPTGEVASRGLCTFVLSRKAPFWAKDLVHRTLDWEGEDCKAYQSRLTLVGVKDGEREENGRFKSISGI